MDFSDVQIIDIFIRCGALGQLILICAVFLRRPITSPKLSLLGVEICAAAYLSLTAPIPDNYYGNWRNVLLVFTDALPYAIWLAAFYFLEDDFAPRRWPLLVKVGIGLFAVWHIYFFGFLAGRGIFHDFSHAIAIVILVHVLFVSLRGLSNDLVDSRRRARVFIAVLTSIFGIYLALGQLVGGDVRLTWQFGLFNALFIFLSITVLARYLLSQTFTATISQLDPPETIRQDSKIPHELKALRQKLDDFMDGGGYCQSGLTIKELAKQMSCPEHRLRRLINANLGFRNFSAFLNSRRLRDACAQLEDQDQSGTPILTLALNLGYGSIGPFNRAFKAEIGMTPSEYRLSFQNRR
jgi:AraC-like DNA-binding protein